MSEKKLIDCRRSSQLLVTFATRVRNLSERLLGKSREERAEALDRLGSRVQWR
jgi:hypothetical protein